MPIPGGSFRLDPVAECAEPGTGELVYTGPNVMLGYATSPADLAAGRPSRAAHRRPGPASPTASTRSSAGGAGTPSCSACGSTSTGSSSACPRPGTAVRCVVADDGPARSSSVGRGPPTRARRRRWPCGLPPGRSGSTSWRSCRSRRAASPDHAALERQARWRAAARPERPVADARRPPTGRSATTTPWCSAARTPPWTTASSSSAATRCRTSSWPPGSAGGSATCPPTGTPGRSPSSPPRGPAPGGASRRWTPPCCCARSRSVAIVGTHANLFTVVGGAHCCSRWPASTSPGSRLADAPRATRVRQGPGRGRPGRRAEQPASSARWAWSPAATRCRPPSSSTASSAATTGPTSGSSGSSRRWSGRPGRRRPCSRSPRSTGSSAGRRSRLPWLLAAALVASGATWTGVEAGPTERYTAGVVAVVLRCWAGSRPGRTRPQRVGVTAAAWSATAGFFGDPTARELVIVAGVALLAWLSLGPVPGAVAPVLRPRRRVAVRLPRRTGRSTRTSRWTHPLLATLVVVGGRRRLLVAQPARAPAARSCAAGDGYRTTLMLNAAEGPSAATSGSYIPRRARW